MESFDGNQVVGFWHEDSFIMNLLLREVTKENCKMSVLVTGDPRGDYMQFVSVMASVIPEHFGNSLHS